MKHEDDKYPVYDDSSPIEDDSLYFYNDEEEDANPSKENESGDSMPPESEESYTGYTYNDSDDVEYNSEETDRTYPDYDELDNSGPNYSQAELEESEDEAVEKDVEDLSVSPFWLLLKVLLNPIEGWKSIRRARLSVSRAMSGCFYPLLVLVTLSEFGDLIYNSRIGLQTVFVSALNAFVSFFFGYFVIVILLKLVMPGYVKKIATSEFGKVFVIMCLSSLCLFYSAIELLPMLWAVLIFLPLWTIYIICRGARFFRFPYNKQITCTGLLCFIIVGVPYFINWLLTNILPV